ncbi:MAG: MBL fold metallo-hydrolase [Deltaproteobacteria bacterium]|nr:MBL fold metallo-hydrolase [Deltaproteobacteria bacterium]
MKPTKLLIGLLVFALQLPASADTAKRPTGIKLRLANPKKVTPSGHVLTTPKSTIVVDPGADPKVGIRKLSTDAKNISAIVLTHEHLDHLGALPTLVRHGFKGKIYGTSAALDAAKLMLWDGAKIQRSNAKRQRARLRKEGKPCDHIHAAYNKPDVEQTISQFRPVEPGKITAISPDTTVRFELTGHVLGAASALLDVGTGAQERKILFSGDLGRANDELHAPPKTFGKVDYVVQEYTYGGRPAQGPKPRPMAQLNNAHKLAKKKGGRVVIAAFALGRTQTLLFMERQLRLQKPDNDFPVYLDTPLGEKLTQLYKTYPNYLSRRIRRFTAKHGDAFSFPQLHVVASGEESKGLATFLEQGVVIAGGGMATGGRVVGHLKQSLPNPNDVVVLAGYAAPGTLAQQLQSGLKEVKIYGKTVPVNATVMSINGLSGHRSHQELVQWAKANGEGAKIIPNHGNGRNRQAFVKALEAEGLEVLLPRGDVMELN